MYKFVVMKGNCGSPYDITASENQANKMAEEGFELAHMYQSTSAGCGGTNSVLVLVFKKK